MTPVAKKHELATLSKANKDLSLLIDEDLQKESELLQKLIKEVYEANQKVKESHTKRVQETNEKLKHLNREIDTLKKDIDDKDQATTTEQFNHLLKSKDDIYEALNSVRLFDKDYIVTHPLSTHITLLMNDIDALLSTYKDSQDSINETYLSPITKETLAFATDLFKKTETTMTQFFLDNTTFNTKKTAYLTHTESFKTLIKTINHALTDVENSRTHFFFTSEDETYLDDKIDSMYDKAITKINQKLDDLEASFKQDIETINYDLETLETETLETFKQKYKKQLESEQKTKETLEEDLDQLRFDIMKAEKNEDLKQLKTLLKQYEQKEKQNLSLYEEKVKQLAEQKIKKHRQKLLNARKHLELTHEDEKFKLLVQLEKEKIKFKESSTLFKLREDQKALEFDLQVNHALVNELKTFTTKAYQFKKHHLTFVESIKSLAYAYQTAIYKDTLDQLNTLTKAKQSVKEAELALAESLRMHAYEQDMFNARLKAAFDKTKENIGMQYQVQTHLKNKLNTEKTDHIETIKAQEDAKNDLIYEHSRIEIAEKEYELQLIKIRSLYDNEVDLTKSQAERLNIGMDVNETMVKTTVESQILFAEQQIKFAEKEYEARLENVERTKRQELEYAEQKLYKAEQPYLYEQKDIEDARDTKLEDLSYRLALFTDEKDRKKLKEQEESITAHYQEKLDALQEKRDHDQNIKRYKSQIDAAIKRADQGVKDAQDLKEKTIQTFEELLDQSKEKRDLFNKRKSGTLIPYIKKQSTTTAEQRLDEALEEAKAQRDDKIKDPKETIAQLEEKLNSLKEEKQSDTSDIDDRLATLFTEHHNTIQAIDAQKKETIKTILADIEKTKAVFSKARNEVKSLTVNSHYKDLKRTLLRQVKKAEAAFDQTLAKTKKAHTTTYKKHLKALDQKTKTLNKTLDPLIKSYKRYLKNATSSQEAKIKPIIKQLDDKRKDYKAAIEANY